METTYTDTDKIKRRGVKKMRETKRPTVKCNQCINTKGHKPKSLFIETPGGVVEIKPTDKRYKHYKKVYG